MLSVTYEILPVNYFLYIKIKITHINVVVCAELTKLFEKNGLLC